MITTNDLSKSFGTFKAVDGVTLEVGKSEVLALLGPNGAGKTTTVRMLTSILRPTRGTAFIAGYDVAKQPAKVRAAVGVLTEHHGLYNRMPAHEYLDFFGQVYGMGKEDRNNRIDELLQNFGLMESKKRRIGEFSKGMRQKLALARAMLHDPGILLLDEPTSAMDPQSARLVRDSIKKLRGEDRSVIICTHNLSEAEELADRIAIIRLGKIIANGSPDELKEQLLGEPTYELQLDAAINGRMPNFPDGVSVDILENDRLQIHSDNPSVYNPLIVKLLVEQDIGVISFQEIPRSLEGVYMQAMAIAEEKEAQSA